jgi:hypothetical protein
VTAQLGHGVPSREACVVVALTQGDADSSNTVVVTVRPLVSVVVATGGDDDIDPLAPYTVVCIDESVPTVDVVSSQLVTKVMVARLYNMYPDSETYALVDSTE